MWRRCISWGNNLGGCTDSCHSRVIQNQQYLCPKFPSTAVVKLLQYSGSMVELRDGFHRTNDSYHDSKW